MEHGLRSKSLPSSISLLSLVPLIWFRALPKRDFVAKHGQHTATGRGGADVLKDIPVVFVVLM